MKKELKKRQQKTLRPSINSPASTGQDSCRRADRVVDAGHAPQFHIIGSGFRENYFYDENKQFVGREDFKARIEAMQFGPDGETRVEVTQKLFLHQYRSVILNERLATKEGKDMRRLAARHSLGPTPLVNLDQIAAAMANEKIQFRDLQNIVIDRVSDAQVDSDTTANHRALKKNREDVSRWLEDFHHLSKVMRAEPQAKAMLARVETVRAHHLALCTLHVAVKEALAQVEREQTVLAALTYRANLVLGVRPAVFDGRKSMHES